MTIASFIVLLFFIAGEPVTNIGNCETAAAVFITSVWTQTGLHHGKDIP